MVSRPQGPGLRARLVVLAPNWLGDAVLALPAIADLRRAHPQARLAVAARGSVADLFRLVPSVDDVLELRSDARWWRRAAFRADVQALRGFDAALLLPNSFQSAWLAKAAAIPERWGYASDLRTRLLTRAVRRMKGIHQAAYYQGLTAAVGCPSGPLVPQIDVPEGVRARARELLAEHGHTPGAALVVLAPGAAYGRAKQWIPEYVAQLVERLARERGATCAIVGSRGDAPTTREILGLIPAESRRLAIDLTGSTSLEALSGVLALADVCVCNDSGAMHLAAACGAHVVATFGPTNEHATRPLPRTSRRADVLTQEVWCRPCMLRECPIDHRCMRGLTPERVFGAVVPLICR